MKLRWPSLRRPAQMSSQPAEQQPAQAAQQHDEADSDQGTAPLSIILSPQAPIRPPLRKPRLHRLSQDSRFVPADDEADLHIDAYHLDRLGEEAAAHEKVPWPALLLASKQCVASSHRHGPPLQILVLEDLVHRLSHELAEQHGNIPQASWLDRVEELPPLLLAYDRQMQAVTHKLQCTAAELSAAQAQACSPEADWHMRMSLTYITFDLRVSAGRRAGCRIAADQRRSQGVQGKRAGCMQTASGCRAAASAH